LECPEQALVQLNAEEKTNRVRAATKLGLLDSLRVPARELLPIEFGWAIMLAFRKGIKVHAHREVNVELALRVAAAILSTPAMLETDFTWENVLGWMGQLNLTDKARANLDAKAAAAKPCDDAGPFVALYAGRAEHMNRPERAIRTSQDFYEYVWTLSPEEAHKKMTEIFYRDAGEADGYWVKKPSPHGGVKAVFMKHTDLETEAGCGW
jgi:hypothetical protein